MLSNSTQGSMHFDPLTTSAGVDSISKSTHKVNSNFTIKGNLEVQDGDVVIDGASVKNMLEAIAARLQILVPDPRKLEKFEALKSAYDHYKLMEKLCLEDNKD